MLVASTSVVGLNCTTPAATLLRTPPSRPRASARSRVSACDRDKSPNRYRPARARPVTWPVERTLRR